jgi:hypothetical protein
MKKLAGFLIPLLVLVAFCTGQAEAGSDTEGVYAIVFFGSPLPLLVIGLTIYRIFKRRYQKEIYVAAIAQGLPVPEMEEPTRSDLRKPGIVLIALGIGYFIAMFITISFVENVGHAPAPLQVSIWGIVPLLIGLSMFYYERMVKREAEETAEVGDQKM